MALVYVAQPVSSSQKSAQAFHGEVDLNGNWFILDANGKEVLYMRLMPGLPSTIEARNAEMRVIMDAMVILFNTL